MTFVGTSVRRKEDRRLLRGGGQYAADVAIPGLLHAAFLRSDLARARVVSIDTSAAEAMPGVVAVYAGGEFSSSDRPAWLTVHGPLIPIPFRPLADGEVRFVGDPVALVVAENRYIAEDACELIEVEYEPLDPIFDQRGPDADAGGALVHEHLGSNAFDLQPRKPNPELDAAFARAARVEEVGVEHHRWNALPMECRGITATWDPAAERLDIVMGAQSVHEVRLFYSRFLGISETQVNAQVGDVGGAFGQKKPSREETSVVLAAYLLGRSVQWIEDRRENLVSATHSRKERANLRVALNADNVIEAMTVDAVVEIGAYPVTIQGLTSYGNAHMTGAYRIPHCSMSSEARFSNTMGRGSYRSPGMFETTAREMMMDIVARRLGEDPVEFRRRHILRPEDLPYVNAHGMTLHEITPSQSYDEALERIGYPGFRAEQEAARREGRYLGLGVSVHVADFAKDGPTYSTEAAFVRMLPSGHAIVSIGLTDQGMSVRTTMAQIAADLLGIEFDHVDIVQADTAAPFGPGTGGSKSAVVGGGAVHAASSVVRDKMFTIAAHELEVAPEDLEAAHGRITVRGTPTVGIDVADVARIAYVDKVAQHPDLKESGLEAVVRFRPAHYPTWSNGAHACIVEVDLETCKPRILRYVAVEDCGPMINPQVVDGQIYGAIVQGVGGVLYENFVYDEQGNPLTSTLVDYLMPTADGVPELEVSHIVTPSTTNPGGFKGAAEGGNMSSPAAVANAIADALVPLGVTITSTQLGPDDIFRLLTEAGVL